jgi:hypothetical protein
MLGRVVRAHCWVLRKRAAPVFLGARSVVAAAAVVVVVVSGWCRGGVVVPRLQDRSSAHTGLPRDVSV